MKKSSIATAGVFAFAFVAVWGWSDFNFVLAQAKKSASKENEPIDFAHEVAPIFQKKCAKCHTGTQKKGGLSFNTRHSLLAGGDSGPVVVPKKSDESDLIKRVASADAAQRMPPEGERLNSKQVETLKRWINEDLPWEEGFAFGKLSRQAPLAPRRPPIPQTSKPNELVNPIDRFLESYFKQHNVSARQLVDDAVFARRASFDLVGLPPSSADVDALKKNSQSNRREKFVDRLLDDQEAYASHWLTFWNDLLRNAYHGTGFIDGGRKQITGWLYGALYNNMPFDQFTHELISPRPNSGSEGFTYGIKWRGTVNESQRREIQAAQSVAQVFLGTNLKCASCHDSFVNHWKLTDAYALASVFADAKLELHRCDQPEGIPASVGFLYPQLGGIDPAASREAKMRQLADLMVHPENGRLARTIVNRLWAKLFGRGLVEPIDNMDAEPWHQDLLDFLASDLADHGYDLKRTLRLLTTSRAYQLPSAERRIGAEEDGEFVFRGPTVKRLTAEQFVDTVFVLTSAWPQADAGSMKLDGRAQGGQLGAIAGALAAKTKPSNLSEEWQPLAKAQWLWTRPEARQSAPPETIYLRSIWNLAAPPAQAIATLTADNSCELFINGKSVGKSDNWNMPLQIDVTAALTAGKNVIAIKGANGGSSPNPAGVIGEIATFGADGQPLALLSTDATWRSSSAETAGWLKPDFNDSAWKPAEALGNSSVDPWQIAAAVGKGFRFLRRDGSLPENFRIRAALLPLDTLQAALGRPNREQTVTSRDATPTMLQALELTNGAQLGQLLQRGAEQLQRQYATDSAEVLTQAIYLTSLGRPPRSEEVKLAAQTLGATPSREGIEDLLWLVCMLPEFQLVP